MRVKRTAWPLAWRSCLPSSASKNSITTSKARPRQSLAEMFSRADSHVSSYLDRHASPACPTMRQNFRSSLAGESLSMRNSRSGILCLWRLGASGRVVGSIERVGEVRVLHVERHAADLAARRQALQVLDGNRGQHGVG